MTDNKYPELPQKHLDALLDHIYEHGTASEGIIDIAKRMLHFYVDADRAMRAGGASALQGKVTRHSDQSVLVTFPSSRLASEFERSLESEKAPAAPQGEPTFWFPFLSDRADGVKGHYSITRRNPGKSHLEFISPNGDWVGYGARVFSLEEAQEWMLNALATQPQEAAPFGYVNTYTGQFFKDVEPSRKGNEGHWRTVYVDPKAAPSKDADAALYVRALTMALNNILSNRVVNEFNRALKILMSDAASAQAKEEAP